MKRPSVDDELAYPIPSNVQEAVSNGIKLLDDYFGSRIWWAAVNWDVLDIDDPRLCVCAQVFAGDAAKRSRLTPYSYAIERFGLLAPHGRGPWDFGFSYVIEKGITQESLTAEWLLQMNV